MGRLWDISQTIRTGIPVWPGDTEYKAELIWKLEGQCPVNVSQILMSTHTGTHADAPLHYDASGLDSATVDLHHYIGPCLVIDATESGVLITPQDIEKSLPEKVERILFKTFCKFPHDGWSDGFIAVAPGTVDLIASRGGRLIGIDSPSIDPQTSKTLQAHHRVRHHKMAILEGLVLDQVPPGHYELIAPPLKLAGMDASPVRALLRSLDQ